MKYSHYDFVNNKKDVIINSKFNKSMLQYININIIYNLCIIHFSILCSLYTVHCTLYTPQWNENWLATVIPLVKKLGTIYIIIPKCACVRVCVCVFVQVFFENG